MYATSPNDTAWRLLPRPPARRAAEVRRGVRRLITRYFFGGVALLAALATLALAVMPLPMGFEQRAAAVGAFALLTALGLGGMRLRGPWIERMMFVVLAFTTLVLAALALLFGWGLAAPGLAFYGIFVCLLCAATNRRLGLALALLSLLAVAGVQAGMALRHGAPVAAGPGDGLRLLVHVLGICTGLAGGLLVSQMVARYVRSADDREERFRGLLAVAADAYWEIDPRYRLVTARHQRDESRSLARGSGLGRVPWQLPQFECDPETLDELLTALDSRVPFRDLQVQWHGKAGRTAWIRLSGEPRFDERGAFAGYWGVARDVTAGVTARRALAATQRRYQALFERIPTPLVLHREGRVLDTNPAGAALLGGPGRELLAAYESGDSRERERRRLDALATQPVGASVPVADFRLVLGERLLHVRSTSVQVDLGDGLATLTIFIDDSDRRAAEEAVRRSETMLSHLVATSPDLITLSEADSGRFLMVNQAFERVTGFAAEEAVGRTARELGLWQAADARRAFAPLADRPGAASDVPVQIVTKAGQLLSLRLSAARFHLDRREYLVVNARDVTALEHDRRLRDAILAHASIGIAVTRDEQIVIANPRLEQMLGWDTGTLAGQVARVAWPDDAAQQAAMRGIRPALARGEQVEAEHMLARRDGSTFLARLLARSLDPQHAAAAGTIWLVEDITERRQFEQTLAAARDAAEAASRAKSAFLANTSHELRTPLNGLLHLAQLSRDPGIAEPLRRQYLDQIVDSAQSLAAIVSEILDLSKIEAGRMELHETVFELGDLLRSLQQAYATLATSRGLELSLEIGAGVDGAVTGDALRVRQVLGNYLGNALKFTATGLVRLVAHRVAGDSVRFEVHDSGPGIDAETQARLFRPFTQADDSTTRRHGGTGLGLSICRELATLMGGTVGVDSAPGRGSRFWAELPLPQTAAPAPLPDGRAPPRDLHGLRVLMVEDNPVNMMIAVALLELWGVVVSQATDGRQAVEAVQRAVDAGQPFDAVLMDVQMPVMSGHEATRALRAAGHRVPILALTAAALVTERQAALEAGMNDFLTKPIDADRLREALGRWSTPEA